MFIWIVCAIIVFVLAYVLQKMKSSSDQLFYEIKGEKVLIVTAHPDDECMFFGPTIRQLSKRRIKVHLLCLSSGNFYDIGDERKVELEKSCKILGIKDFTIIEDKDLKDDPQAVWNPDIIATYVKNYVKQHNIGSIITFDNYGVSGHKNHMSTYYGVRNSIATMKESTGVVVYTLDSVNIIRKYSSFIDLTFSYMLCDRMTVATLFDMQLIKRSMEAHRSQAVWYRILYMTFSRYVMINTLSVMNTSRLKAKS